MQLGKQGVTSWGLRLIKTLHVSDKNCGSKVGTLTHSHTMTAFDTPEEQAF